MTRRPRGAARVRLDGRAVGALLDGLPPEVARRDAESGGWVLIGTDSGIPDGHPAEVVVLSGPLVASDRLRAAS